MSRLELGPIIKYPIDVVQRVSGVQVFKEQKREWGKYYPTWLDNIPGVIGVSAKVLCPLAYDSYMVEMAERSKLGLRTFSSTLVDYAGLAVAASVAIAEANPMKGLAIKTSYNVLAEVIPDVLRSVKRKIHSGPAMLAV